MLTHRSPALTAIYNEIKNSDRNRVLELGPMSKSCFQLFSELSCKIQVENLAAFIRDHIAAGKDTSAFDIGDCLIDYQKDEKFDVILAWDLFNYLDLDQIKKLFAHLRPHCKPNTLLYMLRYVEKSIPQQPREFFVKDKYLLEMSDVPVATRALPKYGTLQLLSAMPGYFLQDTLLAQQGMMPGITEHVLRFAPGGESKRLISKSESPRKSLHVGNEQSIATREHLSPALAEVMSLLQSADDFVVLDLGSTANRPEDCVLEQAGAYYRVDLYSLIQRSRAKNLDELNLSVFNHGLPSQFDVILAWDLFNYCSPAQMEQLDKALSAFGHKDTFLLSFMYTNKAIPAAPSKFEVINGSRVAITPNALNREPQEPLSGASLLRLLQAFNMDKTYAYRSGMDREIIEYIFVNQAAVALPILETSA